MENYPMLQLIVRHGDAAAIVLATIAGAATAWLAAPQLQWWAAPAALVAGSVVYAGIKSYAEMVRLVTDMLLPR